MLVFINNEKQRRGGGGGTAHCFRSHQGMNNSQSGEKYLCVCVCFVTPRLNVVLLYLTLAHVEMLLVSL